MRYEIERPMAQDENADDDANSPRAEEAPSDCRSQDRPHDRHDKAVAPWIRIEREIRERGVIGIHAHDFKAREKQNRPE